MLAGRADGMQPLNALSLSELTPGVPVVVMSNTAAVPLTDSGANFSVTFNEGT